MEANKFITLVGDQFRIFFNYDQGLVSAVKTLPNRRFVRDAGQTFWASPTGCSTNAAALAAFASTNGFSVQPQAAKLLSQLVKSGGTAQITATYQGDHITTILINTRCYDPAINEVIKAGSAQFDGETKTWKLPFSRMAAGIVETLTSDYKLTLEAGLATRINAQVGTLDQSILMSGQHDSDVVIPAPEGLNYMGFQKAGIAYAMPLSGVLIADEPGLGKTIQAIGISNMVPEIRKVLVIAPATPRLNWKREWLKWDVKGLSVGIVSDRDTTKWPDTDVVIISFNLVGAHLENIHAGTWDMLVVDEAHNLKNAKARRTQLILGAPESKKGATLIPAIPAIPTKRLVLMTGTPIVNFPIDLWTLISAVNPTRWNDFFAYAKRYCNATQGPYGWDFKGASNLDELQAELRASCMVRRTKNEVLPDLPKKTRQIIVLENNTIANRERKAVAKIEQRLADLEAAKILAYLSNDVNAYLDAAAKLKDLGKVAFEEISKIRHQTALAKVPQVIEMIREALDTSDQKLLVFIHHRDVGTLLMEALNGTSRHVERTRVRKMDGVAKPCEDEWVTHGSVPMYLRTDETSHEKLTYIKGINRVYEVPGQHEARPIIHGKVSAMDEREDACENYEASVHNHIGGYRSTIPLSPSWDTDCVHSSSILCDEPICGSNHSSIRVHEGEHLGNQLESKRDQTRCNSRGTRNARPQSTGIAVSVNSDTSMSDRQLAVDRFQTDPTCRVFVGSIQAAGTALTLTAATMVIFGEVDWVPGNMSQAEDRAHRIGQRDNVLVWHAVVDGTIEARMIKVLVKKQEVIDTAMDGAFTSSVAVEEESSEELNASEIMLPELQIISNEEIAAWLTKPAQPRSSRAAGRITERAKSRGLQAEAEAVTESEILVIHNNLRSLAGVCDGAQEQDAVGFNAADTYVGRTLAAQPVINPLQAVYARRMLGKYVKQLGKSAVVAMGPVA